MANPIDMTLYGSAELTFDWLIEKGLDTGEYLAWTLPDGIKLDGDQADSEAMSTRRTSGKTRRSRLTPST